jgi:hypothetical protein
LSALAQPMPFMKTLRILIGGLLAGCVPALAFAAGRMETYTVTGYVVGPKPSAELIAKAARAVESRMAGQKQTQCADDADHKVEILFKQGQFKVYVDALPFATRLTDLDRNSANAAASAAVEAYFEQRDHGLPH